MLPRSNEAEWPVEKKRKKTAVAIDSSDGVFFKDDVKRQNLSS